MSEVRVRFAPSPTGYLHIGGVRTALYNWLFARNRKGTFILRIEDTDIDRSKSEFTDIIIKGFKWLGLSIDEGPYYQSERLDLYRQYAYRLLEEKKAYKCFCTAEEIEARKKQKGVFQYDRFCLDKQVKDGPYAIRFLVPEGKTFFSDIIRKDIDFSNSQFEDFVILRSNGMPTYNFAVVIDDSLMNINYVIRGDDHITNTPKQILLYRALGFKVPEYAHLPMILGGDGKRLSKRFGATSTEEYKKMGILPEALLNYLARLGWSHGDQEIFSISQLIDLFDLKNINNSPAVFDIEKLEWVNSQHLKEMDAHMILDHINEIIDNHAFNSQPVGIRLGIIDLFKARSRRLTDIIDNSAYIYSDDFSRDAAQSDKFLNNRVKPALLELVDIFMDDPESMINESAMQDVFKKLIAEHGIKMVQLAQAVRVAITGASQSPGLFEITGLIGRHRTINRLRDAIDNIKEDA